MQRIFENDRLPYKRKNREVKRKFKEKLEVTRIGK